jgi:hypothetical protein
MVLRIFLPWMLVGYFVDYAHCRLSCNGAFMVLLNPQQWQNWQSTVWLLPYLYLAAVLFVARTEKDLLYRAIAGTLATIVGTYVYIILASLWCSFERYKLELGPREYSRSDTSNELSCHLVETAKRI